jgi:hypothetical protein
MVVRILKYSQKISLDETIEYFYEIRKVDETYSFS